MQRKAEKTAVELAQAEIDAAEKKRRFYTDRLSLSDTSPESLTTYTRHVVKEKLYADLFYFARINPIQFRKLWLLFQYQLYRSYIDFKDAKQMVKGYVQKNALGVREPDNIIAPNRRQILGQKREQKIRSFVAYNNEISSSSKLHFDIFFYAAFANITDLFAIRRQENVEEDSLDFIKTIYGQEFKLPREIWDAIANRNEAALREIVIELPRANGDADSKTIDLNLEFIWRLEWFRRDFSGRTSLSDLIFDNLDLEA